MSNPSQNRPRDLKPTISQNAYSASPSQLSLSSDLPSSALGNPYQQHYTYAPATHDTSSFAFQHHPQQYRPQLQTHHLPQQQQQQQSLQTNQQSPTNTRKRRISDLEVPGSSSSNASAFGYGTAAMVGAGAQATDYDTGQQQAQVQTQLPSPVAKKGRTNTPWTPAEEQRLKALRDAGSSWSEIAKTFPTRTEGSVKKHWYKDMHYAEFAEDESAALLQAIKDYETNKWKVIGQKVGKPAKACEQFAKEQGWKLVSVLALGNHENYTTNRPLTVGTTALSIVFPQTPPASPEEACCQSFGLRQLQCQFVTLAKPYQDFDFPYGGPDPGQQEAIEHTGQVTGVEYEQLLTKEFHPGNPYLHTPQETPTQSFPQHGMAMLPSQMSAPEPSYSLEPPMYPSQMARRVSQPTSSHYGSPYESPQILAYQQEPQQHGAQPVYQQPSRKRSRVEELSQYDYQGVQQLQAAAQVPLELTPRGHHAQPQSDYMGFQYQFHQPSPQRSISGHSPQVAAQQQTSHHHHRLPNQPPASKCARLDSGESSSAADHGPPSVVGQPGMPEPAIKPKGPKLKFTPEDDALLVELKETKNLTWKQIADFFPGRSSGTLQVRYCTKLKAKTTAWTDDMIQRLRNAIQEYENDRWRIISGKVGNGFSATACKDKATQLDIEDEDTPRGTDYDEAATPGEVL